MKINKSLNYILPLVYNSLEKELVFDSEYFVKKVLPYLKNSFVKYRNKNCFALLLSIEAISFLEDCKKSINFLRQLTSGEDKLVVFSIPKEHVDSYNRFLNGKYSFICDNDKLIILEFANKYSKRIYDNVVSVLYPNSKTGELYRRKLEDELNVKISKRSELLSKIDVDGSETYRIKEEAKL